MRGLDQLRVREEALRWAADQLWQALSDSTAASFVLGLADATRAALHLVLPDYPDAEEEPPTEATADADAQPKAEEPDPLEGVPLATLAPEARKPAAAPATIADEAPPAPAEPASIPEPKPRAAVPTPQAVIRAWALKEGIAVNTRGHVSTEALERINARRAQLRLPPFGAKPWEVDEA